MEEKLFEFKLLTDESEIFSSMVRSVILPGEKGEFGVLENHSNLVSKLSFGLVKIKKEANNGSADLNNFNNKDENFDDLYFISKGGVAHFFEDKLIVLVDRAMKIENKNSERSFYTDKNNISDANLSKEEKDFDDFYEYIKSTNKTR